VFRGLKQSLQPNLEDLGLPAGPLLPGFPFRSPWVFRLVGAILPPLGVCDGVSLV